MRAEPRAEIRISGYGAKLPDPEKEGCFLGDRVSGRAFVKLFQKHGMENVIYWTKTPDQKDANTTLIYLLAHKDKESARKSFDAFRQDPDWLKAKTESEKEGSLTVPNGVKSEFLVPTDYSQLK